MVVPHDTGLAEIVDYRDLEVIAVNMPNQPGVRSVPWETYLTTVDAIEALTGYDLLSLLPEKVENPVESGTKPPFAVADGPYTSSEGSAIAMSAAASFDPNGSVSSYAWSFGDGASAMGPEVNHVYAQDGAYTVTLTVTDEDGLTDQITTTATVSNVAPAVGTLAGADSLLPGETYGASGGFTDPGADTWSATVDYGDGGGASPLSLAATAFTLSHTYTTAGTFTVTVSVTDDDTTSATSATVTVISHTQALQDASAIVDGLVAAEKINVGTAKALNAKLSGAVKNVTNGDVAEALEKLEGTIEQVNSLVASGRLGAADAASLQELLDRLIRSLRG